MRKLGAVILIALLSGCSAVSGAGATQSAEAQTTPSATLTETTPEPTPDRGDEPSDMTSHIDAENVIYRMAAGKLTLTAPGVWTQTRQSTRAFPLALANAERTARIVVGEVGAASLTPSMDAYANLLTERLGLGKKEIVYLGEKRLGARTAPTFRIATGSYKARIFLVTANDTLYEVTARGANEPSLDAALGVLASISF